MCAYIYTRTCAYVFVRMYTRACTYMCVYECTCTHHNYSKGLIPVRNLMCKQRTELRRCAFFCERTHTCTQCIRLSAGNPSTYYCSLSRLHTKIATPKNRVPNPGDSIQWYITHGVRRVIRLIVIIHPPPQQLFSQAEDIETEARLGRSGRRPSRT
jgi:hypothetical protein